LAERADQQIDLINRDRVADGAAVLGAANDGGYGTA
jgi:hypothetical protein